MPKSRSDRKKAVYTPPPKAQQPKISPRWLLPAMLFFLIFGVAWIAVFYVTGGSLPFMEPLGNWNLLVGFGSIVMGVILSTKWY
ncbi:MAG: cell division protein CrgA [Streptosporangiales bacterium]|nr:cell division protein CrgA [Streptosporangiales bacterium]